MHHQFISDRSRDVSKIHLLADFALDAMLLPGGSRAPVRTAQQRGGVGGVGQSGAPAPHVKVTGNTHDHCSVASAAAAAASTTVAEAAGRDSAGAEGAARTASLVHRPPRPLQSYYPSRAGGHVQPCHRANSKPATAAGRACPNHVLCRTSSCLPPDALGHPYGCFSPPCCYFPTSRIQLAGEAPPAVTECIS